LPSKSRISDAVIGLTGAAHPTFIPALADEIEGGGGVLRRPYWGPGLATRPVFGERINERLVR
jgi:hypothetical protein